MSPTAASPASRREAAGRAAARRETARRRARVRGLRRAAAWVAGLVVLGVAVIIAMPDAKKLYNDLTLPLSYQDVIRQQAAADHLDPALVAAVIDTESKFDPSTSSAGAVGLMQLLPSTAEFLARRTHGYAFKVSDLQNPQVNITYGCYYLRFLLDEFNGNVKEGLAAYNGGETNVANWISNAHAAGHAFGVSDIPFPETRAYVAGVLSKQQDYRHSYPSELGYR
jgi:soluble lytic murein transglycosylase